MPTLFLTKVPKIYNGEKTAFSTNVAEKKSDYFPAATETRSCTSTNSKWIKTLNIRLKTLQLVQEIAQNTLEAIDVGKDFLNRNAVVQN
jgi:hypothetical protein